MRYINTNDLEPGMRIGADIYGSDGQRFFLASQIVTDEMVHYIRSMELNGIYVSEPFNASLEINPIISPKFRGEMMSHVKKANVEQCIRDAKIIYREVKNYSDVPLDYIDIWAKEDCYYAHSVNVAIISAVIAINMGLSYKESEDVIIAALLHDIGMFEITKEVLMKNTSLSQSEYLTIKMHPTTSYNMLKDSGLLSDDIKKGILYHHENENGSGYPDKLIGNEIPLIARILHVADTYEALTSKRPYKEPYTTQEAYEYMNGGCDVLFYDFAVKALTDNIPIFPKGTPVKLSSGEIGVVYTNTKENRLRPVILPFQGKSINLAKPSNSGIVITSLMRHADFSIEELEKNREAMLSGKKNYRIMAVDDQKTNLSLLREILEDYYDLTLLKSGEQALKYLENNSCPDLILMDINMPDMDGIETTKRIQAITGGMVPVLFVSSNHDRETVLACRNLNCVGYIARPYNAVYIKSEIKRILTGEA